MVLVFELIIKIVNGKRGPLFQISKRCRRNCKASQGIRKLGKRPVPPAAVVRDSETVLRESIIPKIGDDAKKTVTGGYPKRGDTLLRSLSP